MDINKKTLIFLICALVFSLGQIPRIMVYGEVVIHLNDLLMGLIFVGWLGKRITKKEIIKLDHISKSALLFVGLAIVSLLFNLPNYRFNEILIGSLYLVRWVGYFGIYLILINDKEIHYEIYTERSKFIQNDKKRDINIIFISFSFIALIGLLQYIFFPDLKVLEIYGWDPHLYRLTAPFFDPTFTGAILVMGLILLINLYWIKKKTLLFWLFFLVIYLAGTLTYSRAVYLMYFMAMIIIALIKKAPKFLIGIMFLGLLTFIFLPQQKSYGTSLSSSETFSARVENWQRSLAVWKKQPFFGSGFNTYRYAQKKYGFLNKENYQKTHAGAGGDSSLLFVLATTGILGITAFINLFRLIIQKICSKLNHPINLALFVTLIGLLIHSIFANSLFYPWIMQLIWIETAFISKKN